MTDTIITTHEVPTAERAGHVAKIFGSRYVWFESYCFDTAGSLCAEYSGGQWKFQALSNGGFYLKPTCGEHFLIACANGFEGSLSADAFGITCSMYGYSLLSFSANNDFGQVCADQYHYLRDFMLQHEEAAKILKAID